MSTIIKQLADSSSYISSLMQLNIPVRLGVVAKGKEEFYEGDPGDFALKCWYFENDGDAYACFRDIYEEELDYSTVIRPISSESKICTKYMSDEEKRWIEANEYLEYGQRVKLTESSPHFAEYGNSSFNILATESPRLNSLNDSSKGKFECDWDSDDLYVIIAKDADAPRNENIPLFDYRDFRATNNLKVVCKYTTLLSVKLSEIIANK